MTYRPVPDIHRGVKILHDPVRNKGTAFTLAEREELGLDGLLPPHVMTMERHVEMEIANNRMLHDVASADVVITNPTHFLVAISFSDSVTDLDSR